jgi:hypothetical protein
LFLFLVFPAMIAGFAEKFDGFLEDASRAVMCASLVIPGAAFVLAGAVTAPVGPPVTVTRLSMKRT